MYFSDKEDIRKGEFMPIYELEPDDYENLNVGADCYNGQLVQKIFDSGIEVSTWNASCEQLDDIAYDGVA